VVFMASFPEKGRFGKVAHALSPYMLDAVVPSSISLEQPEPDAEQAPPMTQAVLTGYPLRWQSQDAQYMYRCLRYQASSVLHSLSMLHYRHERTAPAASRGARICHRIIVLAQMLYTAG